MKAKLTSFYGNLFTLWALYVVLSGVFLSGCEKLEQEKSACDGLVYKEYGLAREEYLPCAGEMIARLEEATLHLKATLEGDKEARARGVKALRKVAALMKAAGGHQKLLGGWEDRSLNNLNIAIYNTYNAYDAVLRVTMMGSDSPRLAAGAKRDFERGQQALERAKRLY